jgi:hypothetical protein
MIDDFFDVAPPSAFKMWRMLNPCGCPDYHCLLGLTKVASSEHHSSKRVQAASSENTVPQFTYPDFDHGALDK